MKSPEILARNARIVDLRRAGNRVKEIAAIVGVRDHTVSAALHEAGMTKPNVKQLGPKPSLTRDTIDRDRCLTCRQYFRGHKAQFRCTPCLEWARTVCA